MTIKSAILSIMLCIMGFLWANGQSADSLPTLKKGIDVNFLFNYYNQDGNNSAVTGGIGTEKLTDFSNTVVFKLATDSNTAITTTVNINHYSSASTDMIDANMSSASAKDTHMGASIVFQKNRNKAATMTYGGGGATESDYMSTHVTVGYKNRWNANNKGISLGFTAYFDTWKLIYPDELRYLNQNFVSTDKRRSFDGAIAYDFTINKRMNARLAFDPVMQWGLLSTPFHRVYFNNSSVPKVEQLPNSRLKLPVSFQLNTFMLNWLLFKANYRFYTDNFGITSHTIWLEPVFKPTYFLSIMPFYRFYVQSAAQYFAPYKVATINQAYYTSDYDLAAFDAHQYGLGIRFLPKGLQKPSKRNKSSIQFVHLRYSNYMRSNGLMATIWTLGTGWRI